MSIIEDSVNLTPTGLWICGVVFGLGAVLMFGFWAGMTTIPNTEKESRRAREANAILPTKPEEIKSRYGGLPPQTKNEKNKRENELLANLRLLERELSPETEITNKELLMGAMAAGTLHPQDAKDYADEIRALTQKDGL